MSQDPAALVREACFDFREDVRRAIGPAAGDEDMAFAEHAIQCIGRLEQDILKRLERPSGAVVPAPPRAPDAGGTELQSPALPQGLAPRSTSVGQPGTQPKRVILVRPGSGYQWCICVDWDGVGQMIEEDGEYEFEFRMMTQAEIDALPEFEGW